MNDATTASASKTNATFGTIAVWVISTYAGAQLISNVASLKIGLVAGYAVDMGTFLYPITFTLRDLVHKVLGRSGARAVILAAGALNLFMALYLMWITAVPGDPQWGLNEQFSAVLTPVWRLVAASILAQVVSELTDTEVYHWFVVRVTRRFHWLRVLLSNSVSIPVDNVIFAVGAFGFTLPWSVVGEIFLFNLVIKYGVTLVSLPFIYFVRERRNGEGPAD
ncbi:queuosine precursor transporter [Desulfovibrio aminophilus]|nr:queuosine precursor transporter [Desulfovibrio aminophilus]MCM0755158.1 queuosine precursor transporter [Desulfovibrio aminophilus]